jgi:hypothetical protein
MSPELDAFNPQYLKVFAAILCLALAVPGLLFVLRRRTIGRQAGPRKLLSSEIFSLFASLYAFFLGFSIVTLWGGFVSAKNVVNAEAGAVVTTARLSVPLDRSAPFRQALGVYVKSVIEDEWPAMDRDDAMSERSSELFADVWSAYYAMKPADKDSWSQYSGVGQSLAEINRQRFSRSQTLSGNLYPPIWLILAFGLVGVFAGLLLTNPEQTTTQVFMEIVVAFMVFSCVYLISDLATPFSGVLSVGPGPFQEVYSRLLAMPVPAG